ncbi:hypothetical protein RB195_003898 [Necator americanus]|uniref:Condensin complex subunit 1 C-terminal domain-containing protein n=1 Tax=Necator americanus TaxID=51031 RepID=A0ABR1DQQ6_NECAM
MSSASSESNCSASVRPEGYESNSGEPAERLDQSCEGEEEEDEEYVNPRELVDEFETVFDEKGYEIIPEYYDSLLFLCRDFNNGFTWQLRLITLETLLRAFDSMKSVLMKFLFRSLNCGQDRSEEDAEKALAFSDTLSVIVSLVKAITEICEDEINSIAYANIISQANTCRLGERELCSEREDIDNNVLQCYDILKRKVLEMFHSICTFSVPDRTGNTIRNALRFLWEHEEVDKELLCTMASAIIEFIKHPKFCCKSTGALNSLRQMFCFLRPICVEFNQHKAVAWLLVSTTMELKYLKDSTTIENFPFLAAVKSVSVDGDLDHLLYYMYYFAMDELHRNFLSTSCCHIPRPYILFIESMAEIAPYIFFENIAPLIPILDYDPYTLRSRILSAFSTMLTTGVEETRFSVVKQNTAIIRERMVDEIQLHLSDTALQVRSKAISCCVEMAQSGNVPEIYLRKGLVNAVAEHLTEKTATLRRAAVKFLKFYLARNPFGTNLSRSHLFAVYQRLQIVEKLSTDTGLASDDFLKRIAEQFFDSISDKLGNILKRLVEEQSSLQHDDYELITTPLEEVMQLVVHQLFFPNSVQNALKVVVKLFYLGKFDNMSLEQSKEEIVDSLLVMLRQRFLNAPKELVDGCDENANVVPSSLSCDLNDADRNEKKLQFLEDAFILHDQIYKLVPEVVRSVVAKDLADVREAVNFLLICCRFLIRGCEAALFELYRRVENLSDDSKTEVIDAIASLFIVRRTDGKIEVFDTSLQLLKLLKRVEETDHYAVENLFCVMSQQYNYPTTVACVLFQILETKYLEDRVLAMKALTILAKGNRIFMRQHLREFQKYIRGSDDILACEALRALSNLVPLHSDSPEEKSDRDIFRLRIFDSLFPDIERLLFRLMLSDDAEATATLWHTCARNAIRVLFALSSEVDFMMSRVLGKTIWYAKRSADILIFYEKFKETQKNLNSDLIEDRRVYWNMKWQRTLERTLTIIGEIVEAMFVHISGSFKHELKRVAELVEVELKSDHETDEDYGNFDVNRSEVETDFAYEAGIFNMKPTSEKDIEVIATVPSTKTTIYIKQEVCDEKDDKSKPITEVVNDSEEEKGQTNPTTVDDLIRTHVNKLLEDSLLEPSSTLGVCLTFVVSCMRTASYCKAIRDAATRTFSKFMLISPHLAERGASFLFTVLCCDEEPQMRKYLLTSSIDVLRRFPAMLEKYALFIYRMTRDEDASVRLTAILHLTHLLSNDFLKPRGCLSDVAFCMLPSKSSSSGEREVAAAACNLFTELSKKGTLLVNVLPDIICRLSRYGDKVSMDAFKTVVSRLLGMIGDYSHDFMVEKMCHRFDFCGSKEAVENNEKIAQYFSHFISQLTLSEKSLSKMCSFLPHFAPFLDDDVIFNDFTGVVKSFMDNDPTTSAKETAEELLRKMEYLHKKSCLSEEENKRMLESVGVINLNVSVENGADGCPTAVFSFEDCEQPI